MKQKLSDIDIIGVVGATVVAIGMLCWIPFLWYIA